jgi:outer membrane protein assembly factor BamB
MKSVSRLVSTIRRSPGYLILAALAASAAYAVLNPADWEPDVVRSFVPANPHVSALWQDSGTLEYFPPAASTELLYVHDARDGLLIAFDILTGARVWSQPSWNSCGISSLRLSGKILVAACRETIAAYDADSGANLWITRYNFGDRIPVIQIAPPRIRVFAGSVVEFDHDTGRVISEERRSATLWRHASVNILDNPPSVLLVDAASSRLLWSSFLPAFSTWPGRPPIDTSEGLLVARPDGKACRLNLASPQYLWCTSTEAVSNLAFREDARTVFVIDAAFNLLSIDYDTGAEALQGTFPSTQDGQSLANRDFIEPALIAATPRHLAVYLRDSEQLFMLQLLPEPEE